MLLFRLLYKAHLGMTQSRRSDVNCKSEEGATGALCRRDPSCFLLFPHSVLYVPDLHYGLAHPALRLKAVSLCVGG